MYLPITDYAKKCGASIKTIYWRIEQGKIKTVLHLRGMYIDIKLYPPKPPKRGRRKLKPIER